MSNFVNLLDHPAQMERFEPERETDSGRLRERQGIRRDVARSAIISEQISGLDSELQRIDNEVAEAADKHQAVCLPLQAELRRLEDASVERAVSREAAVPKADARRRDIRAEIERQNTILERFRREQDELKIPVLQKRNRLVIERAGLRTIDFLARKGVADPQLWLQYFAQNKKIKHLQEMRDSVIAIVERVSPGSRVGTYDSGNCEEWSAYLGLIRDDISAAQGESARLRAEMIAE